MIPGSSIKGAIRTALLWGFIDDDDPEAQEAFKHSVNYLKEQLQRRPNQNWVGQGIERRVLGKDPNHDLMRAVQVSDTAPIPIEALEMGVAWTVTLNRDGELVQKREGNREYKTFVEQIRAEQTFDFSIKIDKSLFRQREKDELGYSDRQEQVVCEELAEVCNFVGKGLPMKKQNFTTITGCLNLPTSMNRSRTKLKICRMAHLSCPSVGERGILRKQSLNY